MTRTDAMASSRPRTAGASRAKIGSARTAGGLVTLVAVLLMSFALVVPSGALAAGESTSGYGQKPATTPTTPTTGTAPSKEVKTGAPASEEPAKATSSPTSSSSSSTTPKSGTLPFTGFDLRWSLALGLLLVGAGFSIVAIQRRERRGSR
jgi:hypothetical protein